ncbi:hypothetical protein J5J83_14130 [Azoarcus sp. L1K30]|uniref:hypothetical protein n=1 Tax=Azoarcus sp. L1K30 TaxID=2820277 RepID=UPI001B81E107|nr:hypothetical protein [Azoarcus sp. L1K30]MBR0567258.1 hypothetical protein [Azoarcus sp. L1K30]
MSRILSIVPVLLLLFLGGALDRSIERTRLTHTCVARGSVDTVSPLMMSPNGVSISGWAVDTSGVDEVQAVAGGRVIASVKPGHRREDVSNYLGACADNTLPGFDLALSAGDISPAQEMLEIRARTQLGWYRIGRVKLEWPRPFAHLDTDQPIRWNGRNVISGWALSDAAPVAVTVLADGREIAQMTAKSGRDDVGRVFRFWPHADRSGFEVRLNIGSLPRGRFPLTLRFVDGAGRTSELPGPVLENDEAIGRVESAVSILLDPASIEFQAWAQTDGGIAGARVETEAGMVLGPMQPVHAPASAERPATDSDVASDGSQRLPREQLFRFNGKPDALPEGLHRLVVRVTDGGGVITSLPGPLLWKGAIEDAQCAGEPLRVFFPGPLSFFRSGASQMQAQRTLVGHGCVEVGMRGRVEYLRSTLGKAQDFIFDPDLPESHRIIDGKEMTGGSLRGFLNIAWEHKAPLLITLDGGVWADSAFSVPELDIVDWLEQDPTTVQWNQHGVAEPDDALSNLPGSIASPQLARMMSLNRFNERFLAYKKRNLQAAVREIVAFMAAHPEQYVAISLDPDQYINPWFFLTQWYDYNPDTLRQYREWLFHLGPYADGAPWASERAATKWTLERASRAAGRVFAKLEDVEPPRGALDYADPWQQVWTQFKRHLVARHYADLAAWAVEAGLPQDRVFTGQTFIQSDVSVDPLDKATGWTDQAGVSIRGAKPPKGHLCAILYGPASRDEGRPRSGVSLSQNIRSVDPGWGSCEFHPATIDQPERIPSNDESYRTLLTMMNAGARYLSPMWGSRAQDQRTRPEHFRAYDSYEGTPFETQFIWWLKQRSAWPVGTMLFPFGNDLVASDDGWHAGEDTTLVSERGVLRLKGSVPVLHSPAWDGLEPGQGFELSVSGTWQQQAASLVVQFAAPEGRSSVELPCTQSAIGMQCAIAARPGAAMTSLALKWKEGGEIVVDQIVIKRNDEAGEK